MGRIRKTLAWALSPGGNMKGLVRAESSAESAAREQAGLVREQNRLLASIAQQGQPAEPQTALACCEECKRQGCAAAMNAERILWVKTARFCDCTVHHSPV